MIFKNTGKKIPEKERIESTIKSLDARIEKLKVTYNLFFSKEIPVPPEQEREAIEKAIRRLLSSERKAPRIKLLLQNLAAKFTLYNNSWLKKLHDLEMGLQPELTRRPLQEAAAEIPVSEPSSISISLNSEESFEKFAHMYRKMSLDTSSSPKAKEKLINSLKSKMISANLVDAAVMIVREEGTLKIKIKK